MHHLIIDLVARRSYKVMHESCSLSLCLRHFLGFFTRWASFLKWAPRVIFTKVASLGPQCGKRTKFISFNSLLLPAMTTLTTRASTLCQISNISIKFGVVNTYLAAVDASVAYVE